MPKKRFIVIENNTKKLKKKLFDRENNEGYVAKLSVNGRDVLLLTYKIIYIIFVPLISIYKNTSRPRYISTLKSG